MQLTVTHSILFCSKNGQTAQKPTMYQCKKLTQDKEQLRELHHILIGAMLDASIPLDTTMFVDLFPLKLLLNYAIAILLPILILKNINFKL